MPVVALVEAAGTSACTTSGVALSAAAPVGWQSLFAECDPSGGDLAAWAELSDTPGWTTSLSTGDRSWDGLRAHMQEMPSGLSVLLAPTRTRVARTVVREAAARFGLMLASLSDVIAFADCGRLDEAPPTWAAPASLVLLLVRQAASSAAATVSRVDRAGEAMDRLSRLDARVGVVVVGARPYDPGEVAAIVGSELFGVLAEDPIGASQVGGAWTVGRGAARSALLRSARPVAQAITDVLAAPPGELAAVQAVQDPSEAAG
jgi:hypothetical protein